MMQGTNKFLKFADVEFEKNGALLLQKGNQCKKCGC